MRKIIRLLKNETVKLLIGAALFAAAIVIEHIGYKVLSTVVYVISLLVSGFDVYLDAIKGILRKDFLDEKFLMSIASVGAFIIGDYTEGVAVMLFFLVGEIFEHKAVARSRGKIRSLMDICPDEATVIRGDEEVLVDADEVEVGDIIVVRAGERVAIDSVVISGYADADLSALTGESIPMALCEGSIIESGSIILNGVLHCRAIKEASESSAQRIIDMVENASENKSKEESFITAFSKIYTPIVVSLAVLMATVPSIFGFTEWSDSIYRALIFLVISCPCALVISVPMAFFGGIGAAASRGILFKGGNSFSSVARTKIVAFDKTGTLTTGHFAVKEIVNNTIEKEELIRIAAGVEYASNHPIALCIRRLCYDFYNAENIREIPGKGTVGFVGGKRVCVGNELLMRECGANIPIDLRSRDDAMVYCSVDDVFAGAFVITDDIKYEAVGAVESLKALGVSRTLILSGDKKSRVEEIGEMIGIDEVKAQLLPEDKYAEMKRLIDENNGKVMYVGDGINDSPALALADVGVAMGAIGSDSAIESADLVIMSDSLSRIAEAMKISRKTLRIAKENIIFALGIKISIMILAAFGIANMWLAVFADVGVAVLAILNSMRTLIRGKREK